MTRPLLCALAISLLFTLIFEILFFKLTGKKNKKDLVLVYLVNVLTNPPVVLIYWLVVIYTSFNSILLKVILESCAILVEAYCYKHYGEDFNKPLIFSLGANIFSFTIGLVIQLFT